MIRLVSGLRSRNSLARQLAGAVIGSAGLRLLGMGLSFLSGVQLARYLGAEQYGIYGYTMAAVGLTGTVAAFGVPALATREAAMAVVREDWEILAGLTRWSFGLVVALSVIAAGITAATVSLSGHAQDNATALWAALTVPLSCLMLLSGAFLRGLGLIVAGQSLDTVMRPAMQCTLLAVAFAMWGHMEATTALGLSTVAFGITAAGGLYWLARVIPAPAGVARQDAKSWIRAAVPMGATNILRGLDAQLPLLVLGAFVQGAALGTFRVALSSLVLMTFSYTLLGIIAPPIAARLHAEGDRRRLQMLASTCALFTVGCTTMLAAGLFVYGQWLIELLFGIEYVDAWAPLMVLCVSSLISAAFGVSVAVLYAAGEERFVTMGFALGLVTGIALLAILAPLFGALGAAWAMVGSVSVRELVLYASCRRRAAIDPSVFAVPFILLRNRSWTK